MTEFINCGTVCCVMIKVGRKLALILRGNKDDPDTYGQWALPGGFQEGKISEPVRETAIREVMEEIGILIPAPTTLKLINVETDEYKHNVIFWEAEWPWGESEFLKLVRCDPKEVLDVKLIEWPVETCYPFHTIEVKKFFERHR